MPTTTLEKPDGKKLYTFCKVAYLVGADQEQVIEVIDKWISGTLAAPFSKEEFEQNKNKPLEDVKPMISDTCAACLATCVAFGGTSQFCAAACKPCSKQQSL